MCRWCICAWCEGELVEPPLLEPAELMEHMELFLLPRLEGEDGGVWKMTPPSADLMSLNTYRDSHLLYGDVGVLKLYLSINPCEVRCGWREQFSQMRPLCKIADSLAMAAIYLLVTEGGFILMLIWRAGKYF